jgi:hypothetical protein
MADEQVDRDEVREASLEVFQVVFLVDVQVVFLEQELRLPVQKILVEFLWGLALNRRSFCSWRLVQQQ